MADDCKMHDDVLRRLRNLEEEMKYLRECMGAQELQDGTIMGKLDALEEKVQTLKDETIATLKVHMDRVWVLIDRGVKLVVVLVAVILAIAGIKVGIDVLQLLP